MFCWIRGRPELVEKFLRDIAAVMRKPLQDHLGPPSVHGGRIIHLLGGTSEFGGQIIARLSAPIEIEDYSATIAPSPAGGVAEGMAVIVGMALGAGVESPS
jgi:hypothetical protein